MLHLFLNGGAKVDTFAYNCELKVDGRIHNGRQTIDINLLDKIAEFEFHMLLAVLDAYKYLA